MRLPCEEGQKAAKWLLDNYKTPGDVNIVELQGTVGSAPAIERKKGFEEGGIRIKRWTE